MLILDIVLHFLLIVYLESTEWLTLWIYLLVLPFAPLLSILLGLVSLVSSQPFVVRFYAGVNVISLVFYIL